MPLPQKLFPYLLCTAAVSSLGAQGTTDCVTGTHHTTIFFINGILTDKYGTGGAADSAAQLSSALRTSLPTSLFNDICVTYAWNSGGTGTVAFINEILESSQQFISDDVSLLL